MFLHSGAGLHHHEYSPNQQQQQQQQQQHATPRRLLTRSPYSTPSPQRNTLDGGSPTGSYRSRRPLSESILRYKEPLVPFQELDEAMHEDDTSVANSEGSGTTASGGRKRRRSTRTSAFSLALPAPTLTQKQRLLQIRPKLLLQLQLLSTDRRPVPAFDVLPSTLVVPRLAKKFPRMFRGKGELGLNDVMVVRSEEYSTGLLATPEGSDSDEEGVAKRDLVAVICQMRKDRGGDQGKAEIVLSDGSVWIATPSTNGNTFEFANVDEHGIKTIARWVKRNPKHNNVGSSETVGLGKELKFTFSIVDPTTRRHPIMSTITRSKLDIPDTYTSLSTSAGRCSPTPPITGAAAMSDSASIVEQPERTTQCLSEKTKTLIKVTGIWLALRQGWTPYFRYNDSLSMPDTHFGSHGRARSMSLTPELVRSGSPVSCANSPAAGHNSFGSTLGSMRRTSRKISPANLSSHKVEDSLPTRSMSTGTAFMQRAAARRISNPPSTVASNSEGESLTSPVICTPDAPFNEGRIGVSNCHPILLPATMPGLTSPVSDIPTQTQQKHASSAYIPTSTLQNAWKNVSIVKEPAATRDDIQSPSRGEAKTSRWKSITNLFRRINPKSRLH